MHPKLFGYVAAYPIFLIVADAIGWSVALYCASREGIAPRRVAPAIAGLTVGALIGAKAFGLIERGGSIGRLDVELVAGYRYPGGLLGFAAAAWVLGRRSTIGVSLGKLADIVAPSFGLALAVMRIGCLLAGCCSGRICTLPWAIRFPAGSQPALAQVQAGLLSSDASPSLPVHPLQVYFLLLALVLGLFTVWLQRRMTHDGQVFLLFVLAYGLGQFLLEFLRFTPLPHVQYMALASSLAAASVLAMQARRGGALGSADWTRVAEILPRKTAVRTRRRG